MAVAFGTAVRTAESVTGTLAAAASYSGYRVTTQPSGFTSNAQGVTGDTGDTDVGWQLSSKASATAAATGALTGTWNASHYGTTVVWMGALLSTAIPANATGQFFSMF